MIYAIQPLLKKNRNPLEEMVGQPLPRKRAPQPFLGMSPVQRFVIAILLFLMSCVLSAFCLILTESVYLPFF